ncbi:dephospho-CoA kinase [Borrelia hermsii]|uniref:Dephospho-CoA kinase n=3 Tax=Borrelia hermsii TaxID=140 RepID=A0AAN0X556_BORHE|nr:dephospho-CoA kinase [Borrelia hermsii]AAX17053.1 dephospho-CoA kinase [Borrelia hermsii DAH]AJW73343.1 dephospho-CoA kinase [Borrelia hermsii CC1]AMR75303.1 Dephospho-CoA kinase [Borrelia hermsii]ANA43351.1 dephospho-CoA kinase [Borrelia hermsii HS1]UCP01557.1 dephospho-CoA kinase [Borrelia hermsii]
MGRNSSIIGITGRISTGKDTASKIICSRYGFHEINVDKIGHIVLQAKQDRVVKIFGKKILNNKNEIERVKLRNIVFNDREKLEKLEAITHPAIYKEIEQIILKNEFDKIIINAALLFKLNIAKFCGHIFIIKANDEIIKKRLRASRNLDENLVINILKWQDDIFLNKNILNSKIINIINSKSYEHLEKEIRAKMKEVT